MLKGAAAQVAVVVAFTSAVSVLAGCSSSAPSLTPVVTGSAAPATRLTAAPTASSQLPSHRPLPSPSPTPFRTAPPTAAPTNGPTPWPSLEGQYVGIVEKSFGCLWLWTASERYGLAWELDETSRFEFRISGERDALEILDRDGNVVASDGDWIGVTGEVVPNPGGFCLRDRWELVVRAIVDVVVVPAGS